MEIFLRHLAEFVDGVVLVDDASEDDTLAVVEAVNERLSVGRVEPFVDVLREDGWRGIKEARDFNLALARGRERGGTHFLVLDADEMLTANLKDGDLLKLLLLELNSGESLGLFWIYFWKSAVYFRTDKLTNEHGVFQHHIRCAFRDTPRAAYDGDLHRARVPVDVGGRHF
jgi:glycosyltransferase involved in cell wall biosynthesis